MVFKTIWKYLFRKMISRWKLTTRLAVKTRLVLKIKLELKIVELSTTKKRSMNSKSAFPLCFLPSLGKARGNFNQETAPLIQGVQDCRLGSRLEHEWQGQVVVRVPGWVADTQEPGWSVMIF